MTAKPKMVYTEKGVRYGHLKTAGSRFGFGHVHTVFYDAGRRDWFLVCNPNLWYPHGDRVDIDTEVTCLKCKPRSKEKK